MSRGSSTTQSSVGVAPLVEAVPAQLALGDVEAPAAPGDALLRLGDDPGEAVGVLGRRLEEVERDPLRRLRPDAGEAAELVDQGLDGRGVRAAHASAEQTTEVAQAAEVESAGDATEAARSASPEHAAGRRPRRRGRGPRASRRRRGRRPRARCAPTAPHRSPSPRPSPCRHRPSPRPSPRPAHPAPRPCRPASSASASSSGSVPDHRRRHPASVVGRLDPSAWFSSSRVAGTSSTTVAPRLWVMRLTESTAGTSVASSTISERSSISSSGGSSSRARTP